MRTSASTLSSGLTASSGRSSVGVAKPRATAPPAGAAGKLPETTARQTAPPAGAAGATDGAAGQLSSGRTGGISPGAAGGVAAGESRRRRTEHEPIGCRRNRRCGKLVRLTLAFGAGRLSPSALSSSEQVTHSSSALSPSAPLRSPDLAAAAAAAFAVAAAAGAADVGGAAPKKNAGRKAGLRQGRHC